MESFPNPLTVTSNNAFTTPSVGGSTATVPSLRDLCLKYLEKASFSNLEPDDELRSVPDTFRQVIDFCFENSEARLVQETTIAGTRECENPQQQVVFATQALPKGTKPIYVLYLDIKQRLWLRIGFPKLVPQREEGNRLVPAGGHIDLSGGRQCLAAGEVAFASDRFAVSRVSNESGHYKPHEAGGAKTPKTYAVSAFNLAFGVDVTNVYEDVWEKQRVREEEAKQRAVGGLSTKLFDAKRTKIQKEIDGQRYAQAALIIAQAVFRAAGRGIPRASDYTQLTEALTKREQSWEEVARDFAKSVGVNV